jgi:hypothetical protein
VGLEIESRPGGEEEVWLGQLDVGARGACLGVSAIPPPVFPSPLAFRSASGRGEASCRPPAPCRPVRVPGPLSYWSGQPELGQGGLPRRRESEGLAGGKDAVTDHLLPKEWEDFRPQPPEPPLRRSAGGIAVPSGPRGPAGPQVGLAPTPNVGCPSLTHPPHPVRLPRVGWSGLAVGTQTLGGRPPDRRECGEAAIGPSRAGRGPRLGWWRKTRPLMPWKGFGEQWDSGGSVVVGFVG